MKTLTYFFVLALSFNAMASRQDKAAIKAISDLEESGDFVSASRLAAGHALARYEAVGLDTTVASMTTELIKRDREVITQQTRMGGSLSIFGLISIKGKAHYDVAKIINTNPRDVARFSQIEERDFMKLQKKIKKLTLKHEDDLIFVKVMAAKALELAGKAETEDLVELYPQLARVAQKVSQVSFTGIQNVLSCTVTDYADRSQGARLKVRVLFISLKLSASQEQPAHTRSTCSNREVTVSRDAFTETSSALQSADYELERQGKILSLKMFTDVEAEYYPTWNL